MRANLDVTRRKDRIADTAGDVYAHIGARSFDDDRARKTEKERGGGGRAVYARDMEQRGKRYVTQTSH